MSDIPNTYLIIFGRPDTAAWTVAAYVDGQSAGSKPVADGGRLANVNTGDIIKLSSPENNGSTARCVYAQVGFYYLVDPNGNRLASGDPLQLDQLYTVEDPALIGMKPPPINIEIEVNGPRRAEPIKGQLYGGVGD